MFATGTRRRKPYFHMCIYIFVCLQICFSRKQKRTLKVFTNTKQLLTALAWYISFWRLKKVISPERTAREISLSQFEVLTRKINTCTGTCKNFSKWADSPVSPVKNYTILSIWIRSEERHDGLENKSFSLHNNTKPNVLTSCIICSHLWYEIITKSVSWRLLQKDTF